MPQALVPSALAASVLAGDRRALARALTWIEGMPERGQAVLQALGQSGAPAGTAHRIGITGPPGAGKSTLTAALAAAWLSDSARVGVLAIDPSSPFTGGALLGDRIRMLGLSGDPGVFIRSMASRGASGGLAAAVYDAADVMEAGGFDPLLIETVGVGQAEVEISRAADTTVVVLAPGSGDVVQGMKAGLIEVADLIVVNQADRAGADQLEAALGMALELRNQVGTERTVPQVLRTVATTGQGVPELREALEAHHRAQGPEERLARRLRRALGRLRGAVDRVRSARFWAQAASGLDDVAADVAAGRISAAEGVGRLLELETPQ